MIVRRVTLIIATVTLGLAAGGAIVSSHIRNTHRCVARSSAVRSAPTIFEDVRQSGGLNFIMNPCRRPFTIREAVGHGAAIIDYDNDGLPDIVLLGPNQIKVYHNDGHWHFTDVTARMGLRQAGFWQGIAVGDYDNDGYPDLYVCGYNCSALYHNEHGQGFREVTGEAGLETRSPDASGVPDWRTSAAFVDVNQDGLLDLYVGRYCQFGPYQEQLCGKQFFKVACAPDVYRAEHGSLYINHGQGKFKDETRERGLDSSSGKTLGIAAADFNGDGRIDIALANDEVSGNLFKNLGRGYFKEVGADSGTAYDNGGKAHGGMGIDWGDYDNDGKPDLFVTTYEVEPKNLYHNMGMGTFIDNSELAGLKSPTAPWVGWGAKFLDYNNDGFLDLFEADGHVMDNVNVLGKGGQFKQPLILLRNRGNGTFADVSRDAGSVFRTRISGRALCVGDFDNDGKPDVLISNVDGPPLLLRNVCPQSGNWLGFRLVGTRSNKMGLGCEVRVNAGALNLLRLCTTSGSVLSASDSRVLVGIGHLAIAQQVTIRWPSGIVDTFHNVPAGRYYVVTEGKSTLSPLSSSETLPRR